jgi:hypothetical protein
MTKRSTPTVDPRVNNLARGFETLIRERAFRSALDALSEDVLIRCDEFLQEHVTLIRQHLVDAEAADIISAVVGWILGMPAGREENADKRLNEAFQHNAIAAYISAWSVENSRRVHARSQS